MTSGMFCPDCGGGLNQVTPGDPCPACGGVRRSAAVHVQVAESIAVADAAILIEVIPNAHRPWQEKWGEMLLYLQQIEGFYAGSGQGGNSVAEAAARAFFTSCDNVRDHLIGDLANLGALTAGGISTFGFATPVLVVANAMANTAKHHTRSGGRPHARITKTRMSEGRITMTVTFDPGGTSEQDCDVLTLARACEAAWRTYLTSNGVTVP